MSSKPGERRANPVGKIKRFDCYPAGTVILTPLGVIDDLADAFEQGPTCLPERATSAVPVLRITGSG